MNEYANATEKQSFAFTDWLTTWGDRILTAEILVLVPAFLALQNTFSVNAPPAKNWLGRLGISAFLLNTRVRVNGNVDFSVHPQRPTPVLLKTGGETSKGHPVFVGYWKRY